MLFYTSFILSFLKSNLHILLLLFCECYERSEWWLILRDLNTLVLSDFAIFLFLRYYCSCAVPFDCFSLLILFIYLFIYFLRQINNNCSSCFLRTSWGFVFKEKLTPKFINTFTKHCTRLVYYACVDFWIESSLRCNW